MGQRQATKEKALSAYKYTSMTECEEQEDAHVFSPKAWPPRRMGTQIEEPSVAGRCDLCGCRLVVYTGHATGEIKGIKVNLSGLNARAS